MPYVWDHGRYVWREELGTEVIEVRQGQRQFITRDDRGNPVTVNLPSEDMNTERSLGTILPSRIGTKPRSTTDYYYTPPLESEQIPVVQAGVQTLRKPEQKKSNIFRVTGNTPGVKGLSGMLVSGEQGVKSLGSLPARAAQGFYNTGYSIGSQGIVNTAVSAGESLLHNALMTAWDANMVIGGTFSQDKLSEAKRLGLEQSYGRIGASIADFYGYKIGLAFAGKAAGKTASSFSDLFKRNKNIRYGSTPSSEWNWEDATATRTGEKLPLKPGMMDGSYRPFAEKVPDPFSAFSVQSSRTITEQITKPSSGRVSPWGFSSSFFRGASRFSSGAGSASSSAQSTMNPFATALAAAGALSKPTQRTQAGASAKTAHGVSFAEVVTGKTKVGATPFVGTSTYSQTILKTAQAQEFQGGFEMRFKQPAAVRLLQNPAQQPLSSPRYTPPQRPPARVSYHFESSPIAKRMRQINQANAKRLSQYRPSLSGLLSGKSIRRAPRGILSGLEVRYPVRINPFAAKINGMKAVYPVKKVNPFLAKINRKKSAFSTMKQNSFLAKLKKGRAAF